MRQVEDCGSEKLCTLQFGWCYKHTARAFDEVARLRKELEWANRELGKVFPHIEFRSHLEPCGFTEKFPVSDLDEHDDGTMDSNPETYEREGRE